MQVKTKQFFLYPFFYLLYFFYSVCFFYLLCALLSQAAFADPLLLSNAEMQKLQHYFPASDGGHLSWKGDPLIIQLPLNQEKRIIFPVQVTPDLKGVLTTDQLKIINNDKSLYLTALKPFSTTRMFVTAQDTGEVMLIDISTDDNADNASTTIDIKQNNGSSEANKNNKNNGNSNKSNGNNGNNENSKNNENQLLSTTSVNGTNNTSSFSNDSSGSDSSDNNDNNDDNDNMAVSDNDFYMTLTRFAWQQLFAPERLLDNTLGITRAPMHTQPMVSSLVYGDKVYAHPAISWIYNNTYVTAVELRNKYPHSTTINVSRDLCGDWQAATLYPRITLKPAGDKQADSTVLILISKKPFGESMGVCDGHA